LSDHSPVYPRRPTPLVHDDALHDFRTRLLHQQAESAERRRRDLVEQTSDMHTPAARIRIWERLHETRLPKDPAHGLIAVIAAGTRLTVTEVRHEQSLRFGGPARVTPEPGALPG
jgi:hypothetical protein